jgi:HAD superfamily hydrolase (TIGR01509 family)
MIRALVFDFDGLICDTEGPEFEAWRDTWADFGHVLTLSDWVQTIGTSGGPEDGSWHPLEELARRVGAGFDRDLAEARRRARHEPRIASLDPLPGVVELLSEAHGRGVRTAVASSSTASWVRPLLTRFGIVDRFAHLSVYDGTCPGKPAPDLYLRACDALDVRPAEAVAFEDSPNGVAAAKAAGLWCVAVPHAITRGLDLAAADLVLETLEGVGLDDLLRRLGC